MKNIIMLGGIHGVGKSCLCEKISKLDLCDVYTASNLMRDYIGEKVDDGKKVENIGQNQDILLKAVDKYIKKNTLSILDGHFCLINQYRQIEEIPNDIYQKLKIKAIIVLVDDVDKILKRLVDRDGNEYSLDFINEFQKKEVEYATKVADDLNIDLLVYRSTDDIQNIRNLLNSIVRGESNE